MQYSSDHVHSYVYHIITCAHGVLFVPPVQHASIRARLTLSGTSLEHPLLTQDKLVMMADILLHHVGE